MTNKPLNGKVAVVAGATYLVVPPAKYTSMGSAIVPMTR